MLLGPSTPILWALVPYSRSYTRTAYVHRYTAIQPTRLVPRPVYDGCMVYIHTPHTPYTHTAHTPYSPIHLPSGTSAQSRRQEGGEAEKKGKVMSGASLPPTAEHRVDVMPPTAARVWGVRCHQACACQPAWFGGHCGIQHRIVHLSALTLHYEKLVRDAK